MSVLPKLLSVLVLVAVRVAVAAQNVPVGVQARVCGTAAALEGVYPFMPCTGDGADVFRPQMAGGSDPLASDVVAWWDHATGNPVWAWRLEVEGAPLAGCLVVGEDAANATAAVWPLAAGDAFTFSRRSGSASGCLLLTGCVPDGRIPASPWFARTAEGGPSVVRVDPVFDPETGAPGCSLVVSNAVGTGVSVLGLDLDALPDAVPATGWRVLAQLPAPDAAVFAWTDPMPLPQTNGYVRLYLVKGDGEDSDGDGMPDAWEVRHGLDPLLARDAAEDPDGDGYTNLREFQLGYDPQFRDLPEGEVRRGLVARSWLYSSSLSSTADLATLLPHESFVFDGAFALSPTNEPWAGFAPAYRNLFALSFRGWMRVDVPGDYQLHLGADDGAALYVDGEVAVDNDGDHAWRWRSASVALSAGWHRVRLDYFENWGDAGLRLEWTPPGGTRGVVPADVFAHLADEEDQPPALVLDVPRKTFAPGNAVPLVAHAWDAAGGVVRVDFLEGGTNLLARSTAEPYAVLWHPVPPGSPEVVAVAWNDAGLSAAVTARVDVVSAPEDGYLHGLDAAYFAFPTNLAALPDLAGLQPGVQCVENDVVAPVGTLGATLWPPDATNNFAAVYEGWIVITRPGEYEFSLGSDDGSRLVLDGEVVVDAPAPQPITARTVRCALSAGFHRLRVEYFQSAGLMELWLKWRRPGERYFEPVPPTVLFRVLGPSCTADTDGDGMTDWWERNFGLDPSDPSDAEADTDGDGLSNLAEFGLGTNPRARDTDGDGIPDDWELAHGLNPLLASDGDADADGDGASNTREYAAGTDPFTADTDGDGVSDGEELLFAGSDPLRADYDGTCTTNLVLRADDVDYAYGSWLRERGQVTLAGRCGTVFYTNAFAFADAGIRQIRFRAVSSLEEDAALVCRVDGLEIGRRTFPADVCATNVCAFQTPWLVPGRHVLSFEFQNFLNGARLSLGDVLVSTPGGPDADGNGRPDWMDASLARSRVDCPPSVSSKVSPYCLRGEARHVPLVRVDGGGVGPLPGSAWWRNVPLDPDAATAVEVVYENGGRTESVLVHWEAFDVLSEPCVTVRAGDSLLLALGTDGDGPGSGELRVEGVTNVVLAAGGHLPLRFDAPGTYAVSGTLGGRSRTLAVTVVGGTFGRVVMPVWRGKVNTVRFPGMPVSAPPPVTDGAAWLVSRTEEGEGCALVLDVPNDLAAGYLAAYVGNPDASVLDSVRLSGFGVSYTTDGVYHASEVLPDGTIVVVNRVSAFDLPPGVSFAMRSQSGVCFEDGAASLSVDADTFDGIGDFWYRFFVPAGLANPCQFLHAYVDGKEIAQ